MRPASKSCWKGYHTWLAFCFRFGLQICLACNWGSIVLCASTTHRPSLYKDNLEHTYCRGNLQAMMAGTIKQGAWRDTSSLYPFILEQAWSKHQGSVLDETRTVELIHSFASSAALGPMP